MKNVELIKEFFSRRQTCPMCGLRLVRKLKAYWQNRTRKIEFVSDPVNKYEYEQMIFVKCAESIQAIIDKEKEDQASPNLINLKEKTPPSLVFLNIVELAALCPGGPVEYHLSAKGPEFVPASERFWLKGYDVFITPKNINEMVYNVSVPTSESHVLRYTAEEIRVKIEQLVLLQ